MLSLRMREMAAALRVLVRGDLNRYLGHGISETQRFETALQDTIGVKHALAVNSGTSALICALVGAGIGPGDEVLVPAYTWVSTAAAPLAVGAIPVLVDIDESSVDRPDRRQAQDHAPHEGHHPGAHAEPCGRHGLPDANCSGSRSSS